MTTDASKDLPAPLKALYFNATSKVSRQHSEELPAEVTAVARELIDSGRFQEAVARISACDAWDSTYMGRLLMGNSLFGMQRFDVAEQEYEAAQALSDRRSSVTRNNRAMVFLMREEYGRAAELCQEGFELNVQWFGVWVMLLCAFNLARN
jgi:Flp pilus assembly protein TadD